MNHKPKRDPIAAKKAAREAITRALARPDFTFRQAKVMLGLVVLMELFDRDGDDVGMRQLTRLLTNVPSDEEPDGRDRRWVTDTIKALPEIEYTPAPRGRGARAHVRFIPNEKMDGVGASISVAEEDGVDAAISLAQKDASAGQKRTHPRGEEDGVDASPRGSSEVHPRKNLGKSTRKGRSAAPAAPSEVAAAAALSNDDDFSRWEVASRNLTDRLVKVFSEHDRASIEESVHKQLMRSDGDEEFDFWLEAFTQTVEYMETHNYGSENPVSGAFERFDPRTFRNCVNMILDRLDPPDPTPPPSQNTTKTSRTLFNAAEAQTDTAQAHIDE